MSDFLFTSESVSEGHPDKVADQISDAVLDAILAQDKGSRVAAETLVKDNLVVLAGEIRGKGIMDTDGNWAPGVPEEVERVVRETVRRIGYEQALDEIAAIMKRIVERDGAEQPFFAGCIGIFGHGCVAGVGQALLEHPEFTYYQVRNEQGAVHAATAYTRVKNRLLRY